MFESLAAMVAANAALIGMSAVVVVSTVIITKVVGCCSRQTDDKPTVAAVLDDLPPQQATQLDAELVSLSFNTSTRVSLAGVELCAPHWHGADAGASRAAVWLAGESETATLTMRIKITRSVGQPALGRLHATLGPLTFDGKHCPLSVGDHDVDVAITGLRPCIDRLNGAPAWTLTSDVSSCALGATPLELFVILAPPGAAFDSGIVWAEALRFLCDTVKLAGIDDEVVATQAITAYCHTHHGLRYGSANHYAYETKGGRFCLDAYMAAVDPLANCYDQASAVQVFAHAVGAPVDYKYADTYGYIMPTNLMGTPNCNNPGFALLAALPLLAPTDLARTGFSDHAFCVLDGMVFDACVGPQLGTASIADYLQSAIDYSGDADQLCKLKRENHPWSTAQPDHQLIGGGVTILDRGLVGQVGRRLFNTALVDCQIEAHLFDVMLAFKRLTNTGAKADVVGMEEELERLMARQPGPISDDDARAFAKALTREAVQALFIDYLNKAHACEVAPEAVAEVVALIVKEDEQKADDKGNAARAKQISERRDYINYGFGTAADYDALQRQLNNALFDYDPLTLEPV